MRYKQSLTVLLSVFFMGCVSNEQLVTPPLSIPMQPSSGVQGKILQINDALAKNKLSKSDRASALAQQGQNYEILGLYDLAFVKYSQSLKINPKQASLLTALGVYYSSRQEFDLAFETLDASLEIDPSYDYAEFHRALALYYADRYQLAYEDMQSNYQRNPEDPYRAIWLYIVQQKVDANQAMLDAQKIYAEQNTGEWGWLLLGMITNQVNENDVLNFASNNTNNNREVAEKLSELYFYLGKRHEMEGDYIQAVNFYKLTMAQNMYEFIEHRYSIMELEKIIKRIRDESEALATKNSVNAINEQAAINN